MKATRKTTPSIQKMAVKKGVKSSGLQAYMGPRKHIKERQKREVGGMGREEGDCGKKYDNPDYNNANNVHHEIICSILLDVVS